MLFVISFHLVSNQEKPIQSLRWYFVRPLPLSFSLRKRSIRRKKVGSPSLLTATLEIQFDKTGRPFHDLYYTGKPAYYEVMHVGKLLFFVTFSYVQKAAALIEELNDKFDRSYIDRDHTAFKNPRPL